MTFALLFFYIPAFIVGIIIASMKSVFYVLSSLIIANLFTSKRKYVFITWLLGTFVLIFTIDNYMGLDANNYENEIVHTSVTRIMEAGFNSSYEPISRYGFCFLLNCMFFLFLPKYNKKINSEKKDKNL